VELARSLASEERRAKRTHRASLGRSLSRLRKALKQPNAQWAEAERVRLAKEQDDLMHEIQRLDQELAALNEHIRILEIKNLLLRL
jgi:hypothetical protein